MDRSGTTWTSITARTGTRRFESLGAHVMNRRFLFPALLMLAAAVPLSSQDNLAIRLYADVLIPANLSSAPSADVKVPPGLWRVTSLLAFATVGEVVTTDIDAVLTTNPEIQLRFGEAGSMEPLLPLGQNGGAVRVTATKKKPMGAVFVRVV